MRVSVSDVVMQTALLYTQVDTLDEALLFLMGADEVKRCANEKCRKEFIFKEPLSQKPRSDSQYCSDLCARRTTQRAYVRRKRAVK